jgi:hypothetical protein
MSYLFAQTLVNRAWMDVQRRFLWSFLWSDFSIPTPTPVSTGTVTLVAGQSTVVGDATASAAWQAMGLVNPITTRQFRVGMGTIYNIIGFDGVSTITLDRPYVDTVVGAAQGYQIYGVYFYAPSIDFLWFESVRDTLSGYPLNVTLTREFVDSIDPQRFQSGWPQGILPYTIETQPGAFKGFPKYEIWPAPLNGYTYVAQGFRKGVPFTSPNDTVPSPLGEDVVMALAKFYAYENAEANKQPEDKRNFTFLMGAATKEYENLLSSYMLSDETFSHRHVIDTRISAYVGTLPWVSQRTMTIYAG